MTERPTYPRTGCVVPFCRRTSGRFPGEWICADHWRLVPRSQKILRTRLRKRFEQRWAKAAAERDLLPEDSKARFLANQRLDALNAFWTRTEDRSWGRMKAAAIGKASGL